METATIENSISWKCKHTWKRASVNTLWCLLGCSIGDFGTIYFFQVTGNPWEFSVLLIMSLAIMNGLITSIMLETYILSRQMVLKEAFRVAIGMSLISMIAMEAAMNITDELLTFKKDKKKFVEKVESKTIAITEFIENRIHSIEKDKK